MSVIEDTIALWEKRLQQLRPSVEEARELERLLAQARTPGGGGNGSDRKRSYVPLNERKRQVMEIIRSEPGIKIKDVAAQIGVTGPRVTQIVDTLEREGAVIRDHGLIPVER